MFEFSVICDFTKWDKLQKLFRQKIELLPFGISSFICLLFISAVVGRLNFLIKQILQNKCLIYKK